AYIEAIVADQKALKRGFGVHACRLISYYGVDALGLRRIEAKVYEYNALSINTLKRNNCVQEGVLRKAAYKDGRYWDVYVFGILKEELEELRRRDKYLCVSLTSSRSPPFPSPSRCPGFRSCPPPAAPSTACSPTSWPVSRSGISASSCCAGRPTSRARFSPRSSFTSASSRYRPSTITSS